MPATNRTSPQSRMEDRSRLLYHAAEGAAWSVDIPMMVMKLFRQRDIANTKFNTSPTTMTIIQKKMPNCLGTRRRTRPANEPGSGTAVPPRRTAMRKSGGMGSPSGSAGGAGGGKRVV